MAGEHPPWLDGLSLLSHDLRRPLTVIRGAATLLLEAQDQLPVASRSQILGLIDESVEAMSELIADLSVVSRLAAGTLEVSLQVEPEDGAVRLVVRVPAGKGGEARGEAGFEALRSDGPDPGLALYMARGAARAMGGEVAVAAASGGDVLFSFTLNRRA